MKKNHERHIHKLFFLNFTKNIFVLSAYCDGINLFVIITIFFSLVPHIYSLFFPLSLFISSFVVLSFSRSFSLSLFLSSSCFIHLLLQLSLSHINNCTVETCPVYTRPQCKGRSSMRTRSLPLVWGTGNCRSLSFGSSLDPLRLARRGSVAAGEFRYHTDWPQLRAGFTVEIRSLGIGSTCGRRKSSTCFLREPYMTVQS